MAPKKNYTDAERRAIIRRVRLKVDNGKTAEQAMREVGIGNGTYYSWLKDPAFRAAPTKRAVRQEKREVAASAATHQQSPQFMSTVQTKRSQRSTQQFVVKIDLADLAKQLISSGAFARALNL